MVTLTELAELFKNAGLEFPLPWRGYDGPFCCRSCVMDWHQEFAGTKMVFISNQHIEPEDIKDGKTHLFLNYTEIGGGQDCVQNVGNQVEHILTAHDIPYEWDGSWLSCIEVVVAIDVAAQQWINNRHAEQDDFGW